MLLWAGMTFLVADKRRAKVNSAAELVFLPGVLMTRIPISLPGSKELKVLSPRMGTFYPSNSPADPTFVEEGQVIDIKKTLCLLESMKVFSEISLKHYKSNDGDFLYDDPQYCVKRIIAENGQTVSQGDLLFVIEPVENISN